MARLEPQFKQASELSVEDIAVIVAIGRQQAQLMDAFQVALEACDTLRALGVELPCEILRLLDVGHELVGLERQVKQQ